MLHCALLFLLQAATPAPAGEYAVRIQCLDEAGRALPDARVVWGERRALTTAQALDAPMAEGDREGVVRFRVPRAMWKKGWLLVAAPGRAALMCRFGRARELHELSGRNPVMELGCVRLPRGVSLRGTVRVAERGLAGARVEVVDAFHHDSESRDVARYASQGRCGADGSFEIRGCMPSACRVVARAPGHFTRAIPWVADTSQSVSLTLVPSGRITGRVVGPPSKMGSWRLRVATTRGVVVDEFPLERNGRFDLTVERPGPMRIEVSTGARSIYSPLLEGPTEKLYIRTGFGKNVLRVRAKDAASGEAVRALEAVALGGTRARILTASMAFRRGFESGVGAMLEVERPEENPSVLFVRAPGFAVCKIDDVADELDIEVELERASHIHGQVLTADGKPSAGTELVLFPSGGAAARTGWTDAQGRFSWGGVSVGACRIAALSAQGSIATEAQLQVPENGVEKRVDIRLPKKHHIHGRIQGLESMRDMTVVQNSPEGPSGHGARVGVDGGFVFEHTGAMPVELALLTQQVPRARDRCFFPLGKVEQASSADAPLRFDFAKLLARPTTRVIGRVETGLARIPAQRLLVAAKVKCADALQLAAWKVSRMERPWGWLQTDGSFEIELPHADWELHVHDALSGVELGRIDLTHDALAADATLCGLRVTAETAALDVQFAGAFGSTLLIGDERSDVHRGSRYVPNLIWTLARHRVPLDGTVDAVRIYVPAGDTRLTVVEAWRFDGQLKSRSGIGRILAQTNVDAKLGETRIVRLRER